MLVGPQKQVIIISGLSNYHTLLKLKEVRSKRKMIHLVYNLDKTMKIWLIFLEIWLSNLIQGMERLTFKALASMVKLKNY